MNINKRLAKLEVAQARKTTRQLSPREKAAKILGVYELLKAGKFTLPKNSKWPDVETFKAHMDDMFNKLEKRCEHKNET